MIKKIIIAAIIVILLGIGYLYYQTNIISEEETGKEQACLNSGGTVKIGWCWKSGGNFPNDCSVGVCDCPPGFFQHLLYGHKVKLCDCGEGKCFNGEACISF